MDGIGKDETYKVSNEYKFIQVEVSSRVLERIASLTCAISSDDDRTLSEVHVDLNEYCDLGETDVVVDEIQKEHYNVHMIVFYERGR